MPDKDFIEEVEDDDEDDKEFVKSYKGTSAENEAPATLTVGLEKPKTVREALVTFFEGLHWAIGGEIPQEILLSDEHVNLIINIGNTGSAFVHAVDLAYPLIEAHAKEYGCFARSGAYTVGLDIDMCLYVVHRLGRLNIPQVYLGGIFLIYLKLCEGVKLH